MVIPPDNIRGYEKRLKRSVEKNGITIGAKQNIVWKKAGREFP